MSDPEKALGYQQNHAALAGANLDQWAHNLALAERLDLMLTAESSLADWERKLSRNWYNFANLTIISWHNACGGIINNTTVADDPSVFCSCRMVPWLRVAQRVSSLLGFILGWTFLI